MKLDQRSLQRNNRSSTAEKRIALRVTPCDGAAIAAGALLLIYFAVTARFSLAMTDEASYWLLGSRLSLGDRLISDEWHLNQFTALPCVPFFLLYTRIVGSAEGLILFTRYAFIAFDLLFYGFMYRKLRNYGYAGALSAFLFCAMIPELFFAFSYCTISNFALMALILCLFLDEKKKSPPRLVFCGVLLALAVLEDPFLLAAYLLWALFVAVYAVGSKGSNPPFLKKASFLLEKRTFLWSTLGSFAVFLMFASVLLLNGAFREIGTVLPYLFTGEEYNIKNVFNTDQLWQTVKYYNVYCVLGLLCCAAAAGALRIAGVKNRGVRLALFLLSCGFFAACVACGGGKLLRAPEFFHAEKFCQEHNFPLLLFAPTAFLLAGKQHAGRVCALIAGYVYSLMMDIPSKSFIGMGGFIVRSLLVLQLFELLPELFSRKEAEPAAKARPLIARAGKFARPAAAAAAALCITVCFAWDAMYIGAEGLYKAPEKLFLFSEQPLDHTIEKGPMKGLKTTEELGRIYEATLRDMDVIRQAPDAAVAVLDTVGYPYLYLERRYATYTMSYAGEFDRLTAYWGLDFSTKPDYLYLPYYNPFLMFRYDGTYLNSRLAQIRSVLDCEVIRGEAGYIIRVNALL